MSDIVLYLCKAMRGEFHLLFLCHLLYCFIEIPIPTSSLLPGNFLSEDVILAVSP